jgi:putative LysE/RhtB family amino acid efflux pump
VHAFLIGLALGLFVAAQPGPVSFLLVRTASRGRRLPALMIGLAAASIDATYAALGAAGVSPLLKWGPARVAIGLLGGAVLVVIGARTLWSAWRIRAGFETADEVTSPGRAFTTGVAATASNPLTIASWAAIFAAASVSETADSLAAAIVLVAGIGVASLAWFTTLTLVSAAALRRIGTEWVRIVDVVCGVGLVVCGILFSARTMFAES